MSISGMSAAIRLHLGSPTPAYDRNAEAYRNVALEGADRSNFKHFEDIDLANNERFILVSANGTRYSVTVTDAGVLGTTAI